MAKKTLQLGDTTSAVVREEPKKKGPTVQIFIPAIEDPGEEGIAVDQYEHVTISNEEATEKLLIQRGVWNEIPEQFFERLHDKYGKGI